MIYEILEIKENTKNERYPFLVLEDRKTKKQFPMSLPEVLLRKLLEEKGMQEDIGLLKGEILTITLEEE